MQMQIAKQTSSIALWASLACTVLVAVLAASNCAAMSMEQAIDKSSSAPATLAVVENPELTVRVLECLIRSILFSNNLEYQPISNGAQKRGLDLGISRGFSGSQAGKHLLGLSAASFANGPGR